MTRRFDASYDLYTKKAYLLTKNASGTITRETLYIDFSSLTRTNGFLDKKDRLTQAGFLQVNALIAQAIRTRFRINETTPVVPVSVIGDNGKALRRAAEGHLDDTTSKDGQATIRPWPSKTVEDAKTNLTVGVLTMNTHFSREAWKSPLRCFSWFSSEAGCGAHKVAYEDVRDSVRTASTQLDILAQLVHTVAVHYHVKGELSYGTGHGSDSGARAVLKTEYEDLMIRRASTSTSAQTGEAKSATTTPSATSEDGKIRLHHMLSGGNNPKFQYLNIVAANTHPKDNSTGFDLGDMEAARGHAVCCAPSLYSRSLPCCAAAKDGTSGAPKGDDETAALLG